jgi:hypothetical protein
MTSSCHEDFSSAKTQGPRPEWRDEYLHDLPALLKHCDEVAAWQRDSTDPFERAEAALWSRISAPEACLVFNRTLELLALLDATGELEVARAADNEERRSASLPLWCEAEYRKRFAREFAMLEIFKLLPAAEA